MHILLWKHGRKRSNETSHEHAPMSHTAGSTEAVATRALPKLPRDGILEKGAIPFRTCLGKERGVVTIFVSKQQTFARVIDLPFRRNAFRPVLCKPAYIGSN